ncbi:MAG: hypothetical protein ACKO9S_04230, partial [Bacteroidota bacterium]
MCALTRSKIVVLVPSITNRLRYVFDLVLSDLVGIDYEFLTDQDSFIAHQGPKISYGEQPVGDEL